MVHSRMDFAGANSSSLCRVLLHRLEGDWSQISKYTSPSILPVDNKNHRFDFGILNGSANLGDINVARRMYWASSRKITRLEDRAYSLLGIFDVNMPMIYGEGMKSFRRLQEEIMKSSTDETLFVWKTRFEDTRKVFGLLAQSPDDFCSLSKVVRGQLTRKEPYSMSNRGFRIHLQLLKKREWNGACFAILNAQLLTSRNDRKGQLIRITLEVVNADEQLFIRVVLAGFSEVPQQPVWMSEPIFVGESTLFDRYRNRIPYTLHENFTSEYTLHLTGDLPSCRLA